MSTDASKKLIDLNNPESKDDISMSDTSLATVSESSAKGNSWQE